MTLSYDRAIGFAFPEREQQFNERDAILYALGVGYGRDPTDERDLPYVYEKDLRVSPTFPLVLGFSTLRTVDLGLDYGKVLHGAQRLVVHHDLPPHGVIIARTRISRIVDLGPDKGALLTLEKTIVDKSSGRLLATSEMDAFCRGDGGCGGPTTPPPRPAPMPESAPTNIARYRTLPQAALLYRLSGDLNPLHVDPHVASKAGFPRPILHGLAVLGEAARTLLRLCKPTMRLSVLECRFTAPCFPGEELQVESWETPGGARFRVTALERGVTVVNFGEARFQGETELHRETG